MRAMSLTTAIVACLYAGCATATPRAGSDRPSRNALTLEQLVATHSDNLYDAIAKVQPDWLTSRGPSSVSDPSPTVPSVFMNGNLLGKADYLRQMRVLDVTGVRYWDAGQASARFGMGHPRGVIEVLRK
jgi:hypothetical protein